MDNRIDTQVLIVGWGPVGLTLAIDLAQRGIQVEVAEMRVRDAGLPADYPNDVVFRTIAIGTELSRIPIPRRAERYTSRDRPENWWPTAEPMQHCNRIYLEPILFDCASATPRLSILNRTRVVDYVQDTGGVRATAEDLDRGGQREIFARYLVGCDGAHSDVRHTMGAAFSGDATVMKTQSTYIRAPRLLARMHRPAWLNVSHNPRCGGYVFAIDGRERWLIHKTGALQMRIWRRSTATAACARFSASVRRLRHERRNRRRHESVVDAGGRHQRLG